MAVRVGTHFVSPVFEYPAMRALLLTCLLPTLTLAADRVKEVRGRRTADVKALLEKAGLPWPVDEVYLRAFKQERQLELWAGRRGQPLVLVKTYPFCAASGELGPKRREGDLQMPEGLYEVPEFNPTSNFHLSMKVSYPNASDRVRSDAARPGGLIYLHGSCASIGCIAIEDEPIEEVYLVSLDAKRRPIRFDIFPMRLTPEALQANADAPHASLWSELAPAWAAFEKTKRPAKFKVDPKTGAYSVSVAASR
jgi:murein L,D-transpeptidase YafK